jgi:hypothetical protein
MRTATAGRSATDPGREAETEINSLLTLREDIGALWIAGGNPMKPLPSVGAASQLDDDQVVPDDLIGRLYRATENTVADLLPDLSSQERACLAMFCYRKSHLHRIGLAIAATCNESVLVQTWGTALGQALYAQSREAPPEQPQRPSGHHRSKITLATLTGVVYATADESRPAEEALDDPAEFSIALN